MNRFNRVMLIALIVILSGIALTLLLGDRVGVTIDRIAPLGEARSTSSITIQFSEPMNRVTAVSRFRTEPALAGDFSWSGSTLIFHPSDPLPPGATVRVVLDAGAASAAGRLTLSASEFSFTVREPEVAYLYPATSSPQNIWVARPGQPDSARQVTFSPGGIFDYSVSPNGLQIAFSERNTTTGTTDIKLFDLASEGLIQLTNCVDAACTRPVWRPDGRTIAYERVDFNTTLAEQGVNPSPTRVWLLDLTVTPATTRPLMSDLQMVGHSPQWSADGSTIAFYSTNLNAIVVYNVSIGDMTAVPSGSGSSGSLSPDATQLVYPDIVVNEGSGVNSYLRLADLSANSDRFLSEQGAPLDDSRTEWRPDGEVLAVARRDLRVTRGYQVYELDPVTGAARALTDDPRYTNMYFWWDPTGTQLVMQRFPELDAQMQPNLTGKPEVWTLDTITGALTLITTDGMLPRWVP